MRLMAKLFLVATACLLFPGCGTLANLPDDQLASDLQNAAHTAVSAGLKLVFKQVPDKKAAILKDGLAAEKYIKDVVIPAFSGASIPVLTSAAAQDILSQLGGKVSPEIQDVVDLAITIISSQVPFPATATDGVPDRTKKAVVGVFTGIDQAIEEANAAAAAPVSPTARVAKPVLRWATK